MSLLKQLVIDESGQGITEYALILGLLVLGIWVAVSLSDLPGKITGLFKLVGETVGGCQVNDCGKK